MPSISRTESFLLHFTKFVIYLVPFVPLYIAPSIMFPYITGKNFAFRILVELAAASWLGLIAVNKEYRLRNSAMVLSVLVFTFIVGLADLFGVNPYNSFWSNYERMEGYITVLHLVLYFLIIKNIFRTRKDWILFFSIYVTVSVFVSLFAVIEPLSVIQAENYIEEYGTRRASTIGNPPFLASYLVLSSFLGLILIVMTKKIYLKLLYLLSVAINSIVIYVTASRGAILAAVIGATVIGSSLFLRKLGDSNIKRVKKNAVSSIVALLILVPVIFFAYQNYDVIKKNKTISRFAMMFNSDPSVETRFYTWKIAWNGIKENPVMGWGQENFTGVYSVNPIPHEGKLVWMDRAHNIIIDWLINAGMLGLLSYLAIYGTVFYNLWNNLKRKIISENETIIIATAIVAYFIQNLFTFDTINSYLIFFTLIAYVDNIASMRSPSFLNLHNTMNFNANAKSICATLIALSAIAYISYQINYNPVRQLTAYSQISMSLPQYTSFSKLLDDFKKALSYRSLGDNYIREQMAGASKQILQNQLYRQEGAMELIQATLEEMEKGIASERNNLEYISHAYSFYELLASYDPSSIPRAEALIEKSLRINPSYSRIAMQRVDLYFLKKDYDKAYVMLREYVDQNPTNSGRQFQLALAAILTHREDEMKKTLENIKNQRMLANEEMSVSSRPIFTLKQLYQLAEAHLEVLNYKDALTYYSEILSIMSGNEDIKRYFVRDDIRPLRDEEKNSIKAELHLQIAKIFNALGERENAVREARQALKLDPVKFKEEVKILLNN